MEEPDDAMCGKHKFACKTRTEDSTIVAISVEHGGCARLQNEQRLGPCVENDGDHCAEPIHLHGAEPAAESVESAHKDCEEHIQPEITARVS